MSLNLCLHAVFTSGSLAKALGGRQQQQQRQVGDNMHRLLQDVAGSSDLLKDCIRAREALGTAKLRILRDRDEARKVSRITRSPSAILLHGGSWEDCGWDDDDDVRAGKNVAGVPGDDGEESPAMAAALPLAQEFADKMVELASVVPGLSRSLVELTAVRMNVFLVSWFTGAEVRDWAASFGQHMVAGHAVLHVGTILIFLSWGSPRLENEGETARLLVRV